MFDDVLPDPAGYRHSALGRPFQSLEVSPGVIFNGIAMAPDQAIPEWIAHKFPKLTPTLTFLRLSPGGQHEPNYIHTDRDMGDWTAILYLNPEPARGDGTTFWRHLPTDSLESVTNDTQALVDEHARFRDPSQWEPIVHVGARFNRLVLFPAGRFHSRALFDNYGTGADARLIQVVFGSGDLTRQ
jgi:hypothetical protein